MRESSAPVKEPRSAWQSVLSDFRATFEYIVRLPGISSPVTGVRGEFAQLNRDAFDFFRGSVTLWSGCIEYHNREAGGCKSSVYGRAIGCIWLGYSYDTPTIQPGYSYCRAIPKADGENSSNLTGMFETCQVAGLSWCHHRLDIGPRHAAVGCFDQCNLTGITSHCPGLQHIDKAELAIPVDRLRPYRSPRLATVLGSKHRTA